MRDMDIEDTRQPPDEPEAELCEDCGNELEDKWDRLCKEHTFRCVNPYCPAKHEGVAKEMAVVLSEVLEKNKRLKRKVAHQDSLIKLLSKSLD